MPGLAELAEELVVVESELAQSEMRAMEINARTVRLVKAFTELVGRTTHERDGMG